MAFVVRSPYKEVSIEERWEKVKTQFKENGCWFITQFLQGSVYFGGKVVKPPKRVCILVEKGESGYQVVRRYYESTSGKEVGSQVVKQFKCFMCAVAWALRQFTEGDYLKTCPVHGEDWAFVDFFVEE